MTFRSAFAAAACAGLIFALAARPAAVGDRSFARRCAGLSVYVASLPSTSRSAIRCTLWRAPPISRAIPATDSGSPSTAPSTCHHAAVKPDGSASRSASSRNWPLSLKVVTAAPDSSI